MHAGRRRVTTPWIIYNLFRLIGVVFLAYAGVGQIIDLAHDVQAAQAAANGAGPGVMSGMVFRVLARVQLVPALCVLTAAQLGVPAVRLARHLPWLGPRSTPLCLGASQVAVAFQALALHSTTPSASSRGIIEPAIAIHSATDRPAPARSGEMGSPLAPSPDLLLVPLYALLGIGAVNLFLSLYLHTIARHADVHGHARDTDFAAARFHAQMRVDLWRASSAVCEPHGLGPLDWGPEGSAASVGYNDGRRSSSGSGRGPQPSGSAGPRGAALESNAQSLGLELHLDDEQGASGCLSGPELHGTAGAPPHTWPQHPPPQPQLPPSRPTPALGNTFLPSPSPFPLPLPFSAGRSGPTQKRQTFRVLSRPPAPAPGHPALAAAPARARPRPSPRPRPEASPHLDVRLGGYPTFSGLAVGDPRTQVPRAEAEWGSGSVSGEEDEGQTMANGVVRGLTMRPVRPAESTGVGSAGRLRVVNVAAAHSVGTLGSGGGGEGSLGGTSAGAVLEVVEIRGGTSERMEVPPPATGQTPTELRPSSPVTPGRLGLAR